VASAAVQGVAGSSHALVVLFFLWCRRHFMFSHKIVSWKLWDNYWCTFLKILGSKK